MNWRLASRFSVIVLALLVILIVAINGMRSASNATGLTTDSSGLQGIDLGSVAAPDFRLKDQFGREISLSQWQGKPVVVTFLYTHCQDMCPLVADRLHATAVGLGRDASRVSILAVSMDPTGDTRSAVMRFSSSHRMTHYWHFLIGTHDQLAPIWSAYNIDAQADTSPRMAHHSAALYLIDKEGRERVLLDNDFTSQQLIGDLKVLLSE